jgi:DNA-binding transcriptional regulator YbjK
LNPPLGEGMIIKPVKQLNKSMRKFIKKLTILVLVIMVPLSSSASFDNGTTAWGSRTENGDTWNAYAYNLEWRFKDHTLTVRKRPGHLVNSKTYTYKDEDGTYGSTYKDEMLDYVARYKIPETTDREETDYQLTEAIDAMGILTACIDAYTMIVMFAYESAYTIMLNLNKTWVQKQGDFFVESPIILFATIIWYLRIYKDGKYCTFPHAIEFLNKRYEDIFPILTSYPELENYLSPFMDAWLGGAADQLMGQIASAKIPLSRMISPQLYWVMSGDEFTLDINNPDDPKILVVGNNSDRQNIYGAALGLYNSRIVKLINKKGQLKSSVVIDELPTIYFKGLDNLIATARSNKVAVLLGFQDFSQLKRDYGDKEAAVVMNTVGNIFSGQVVGDTAKTLSDRFGKVLQKRQSMTINRNDKSTSISTQMDSLIPPSKISNLTQGMFVGAVADNFDERIEQKIFHCEIVVDNERVAAETKAYKKIPVISNFTDENGVNHMKEMIHLKSASRSIMPIVDDWA